MSGLQEDSKHSGARFSVHFGDVVSDDVATATTDRSAATTIGDDRDGIEIFHDFTPWKIRNFHLPSGRETDWHYQIYHPRDQWSDYTERVDEVKSFMLFTSPFEIDCSSDTASYICYSTYSDPVIHMEFDIITR